MGYLIRVAASEANIAPGVPTRENCQLLMSRTHIYVPTVRAEPTGKYAGLGSGGRAQECLGPVTLSGGNLLRLRKCEVPT